MLAFLACLAVAPGAEIAAQPPNPPTMMYTNPIGDIIDCRELAARYLGQPAQKAGQAWQWTCPFHADHKTPSFTAYPNGYHCFGCGTQGRPVSLVMAMELMDYRTAARYLLLAARYPRVLVWADEEATVAACTGLGREATAVRSPCGRDANDLLVAGELEPFLHETLARTTESSHGRWLH